jgi:hypothetical protein
MSVNKDIYPDLVKDSPAAPVFTGESKKIPGFALVRAANFRALHHITVDTQTASTIRPWLRCTGYRAVALMTGENG